MGAPEPKFSATVQHWIAGQATAGTGGRSQDVYNPATGAVARQVLLGSVEDVQAAVAAAKAVSTLPPDTGFSTQVAAAQIRSIAVDLLMATGLDNRTAAAELPPVTGQPARPSRTDGDVSAT